MTDDLTTLEAACWRDLRAAADGRHSWRTVVLATQKTDGAPSARTVILRAADRDLCEIEVHTDLRSEKWSELILRPAACFVGYDAERRTQIRVDCVATLHGPGTERHAAVWDALPAWTRTTYCGGPPGHAVAPPDVAPRRANPPSIEETEHGRDRFGVLVFRVTALDWYQHPRGDIRRARFEYDRDGALISCDWIAP